MSSGFWNCRLCDSEPVACHESSQLMQCSSDDCEMHNVSLSPKAWNGVMNLAAVKRLTDDNVKLRKQLAETNASLAVSEEELTEASNDIEQHIEAIASLLDDNAELKAERDRLRDKVLELSSAMLSVNRGRHHKIMIDGDDDPLYWQREEWVQWIVELATKARGEASC